MPYRRARSPFWYSRITIGGRQIRRSLGTTDRAEAERIEQAWIRAESRDANTWEGIVAEYLQARPTDRARFAIKAMRPYFRGRYVQDLTPADIAGYKQQRQADGVAEATIHKELAVFRAALNYCKHELGWNMPAELLRGRLPKLRTSSPRWLTRPEFDRLVKAAAQNAYAARWLPDFIRLAVWTGLRHRELLELTWSRVDLPQRLVYLRAEDQKGGRFSSVPISDQAAALLERRRSLAGDTVLARLNGDPIASVKKSFRKAAVEAGLPSTRIHDLRHTCASWMVQAGVPIRTVAEVLRHKDIATTMIYAHLAPDATRQALEAIAE